MRYTEFQYIEPPRTTVRGSRRMIPTLQRQGWWAQFKRNGSNSVIFVHPNRTVERWNRHGEKGQWTFTAPTAEIFTKLPGRKWWVFNGELMDQQTKHIKDIHFLYDLLVADGVSLFGTPYAERYNRLVGLWRPYLETAGHYVLDNYTWLARTHTDGLLGLYDGLSEKEDEGLMFKRPDGIWSGTKADNWMVKIRRPGY